MIALRELRRFGIFTSTLDVIIYFSSHPTNANTAIPLAGKLLLLRESHNMLRFNKTAASFAFISTGIIRTKTCYCSYNPKILLNSSTLLLRNI